MAAISDLITTAKNAVVALSQLNQTVKAVFPQLTTTATSANTGANGAPPAQVAGYLNVTLPNGTSVKVPYYNV